MDQNNYLPVAANILDVIRHTETEYTFRMEVENTEEVKPGQFFEISLPGYGEAPISVSGIGENFVDFTIRRVGKVTDEIFDHHEGQHLFIRGPYGNGFDIDTFKDKELVIVAGGTGVSPVRGVISHFADHPEDRKEFTLIAGFKSKDEILFKEDFKYWRDRLNVIMTLDEGEETEDWKIGVVTKHVPDLEIRDIDNAVGIAVGSPAMIKFSVEVLIERGFKEENIWISQSRKMCCGLGKCGHCKVGDTYICLDGPVFNYTKGKTLID